MSHDPKELWDETPSIRLKVRQSKSIAIVKYYASIFILVFMTAMSIGISFMYWYDGSLIEFRINDSVITKNTTLANLTKQLEEKNENFTFQVRQSENKTYQYNLHDAGIEIDAKKTYEQFQTVQKRTSFFKKLKFWEKINIPLALNVEDKILDAFIESKMTSTIESPINATLDTSSGQIVINKEKYGNGYIVPDARHRLLVAASNQTPASFSMTKQPLKPTTSTSALTPLADKINRIANTPIHLTVSGKTYTPSKSTVVKWFEPISADILKPVIELNSGRVQEYVEKISAPYSRENRAQVQMKNDDGSIAILVSGRNGTGVNNQAEVIKNIADDLLDMKPVEQELIIGEKPFTTITANDYDKWIHVDVTDKWMYAYENDRLVRSVPISAGAPATPTVIGQFKIYRKLATRDMRGQNADGTNYFQPNVAWVSYFYKGYAIHGNYWRPDSWFGRINSSHGCVSAQNDIIKWFYDWAPVGTPVITHY